MLLLIFLALVAGVYLSTRHAERLIWRLVGRLDESPRPRRRVDPYAIDDADPPSQSGARRRW